MIQVAQSFYGSKIAASIYGHVPKSDLQHIELLPECSRPAQSTFLAGRNGAQLHFLSKATEK